MDRKLWVIIICVLAGVFSCVPPVHEEQVDVELSLKNQTVRDIFKLQNNEKLDSLALLFTHEDPTVRYLAASAFSSNLPGNQKNGLVNLLDDRVLNVRAAAGYALGQSYNKDMLMPLISAFKDEDTISVNNIHNANILEAVGKCAQSDQLKNLATVDTYKPTDTLLLLGQSRGIYRFGLRGIHNSEGKKTMVKYATDKNYPESVRTIGANYLSRTRDLNIEDDKFVIADAARTENNPNIRMALYSALRHTRDVKIMDFLMAKLDSEDDYRCKVNILRALGSFEYIQVVDKIISFLKDDNIHVAKTAANYLIQNGNSNDASFYKDFSQEVNDWRVKTTLLESVTKHLPLYFGNSRSKLRQSILNTISQSNDIYQKAAYLRVLGNDIDSYGELKELVINSDNVVIKNAAAESIAQILNHDNLALHLKNTTQRFRANAARDLQQMIELGDVGVSYTLANVIASDKSEMAKFIKDPTSLKSSLEKMNLPSDIESYNALVKAIQKVDATTTLKEITPKPNKNIDWEFMSKYPDSLMAMIKTDKGIISIALLPKQAPLSVYNFMQLAEGNFYDNKVFHRVVPNFVIQGGCPRGDGFGSADYTIRSEFTQNYYDDSGYVGMASAGPHTESTQFFITHSPAPHLDGKYTIFAKVVDGMDVVHKIQVGDKISDVIISPLNN